MIAYYLQRQGKRPSKKIAGEQTSFVSNIYIMEIWTYISRVLVKFEGLKIYYGIYFGLCASS